MRRRGPAQPELLLRPTYLAVIRGSVGATLFRHVYARRNGRTVDLVRRGDLACAFYVSSVLKLFDLVRAVHLTVAGTARDLRRAGWHRTRRIRPGAVLIWEPERYGREVHRHIGFALSVRQAVSTSSRRRSIVAHHMTFGKKRAVSEAYWHPRLGR